MGSRRLSQLMLPFAFMMLSINALHAQDARAKNAMLKVSGATIDVTLPDGPMKLSRNDLLNWVKASASTVANYYGHFPVPHLTVRMRESSGSGIRHGVTYPKDGGLIFISVGTEADIAATKDDWVLVHEMIHLAFPSMEDEHHWIEEGISTYVEPVARARTGGMTVAEVWRTFVRDMPKGEPIRLPPGVAPTGAAQYSACWPMFAYASAPGTRKVWRMLCAASIAAAATSLRIGTSAKLWPWATKPPAQAS
jgi:hypothetical protein